MKVFKNCCWRSINPGPAGALARAVRVKVSSDPESPGLIWLPMVPVNAEVVTSPIPGVPLAGKPTDCEKPLAELSSVPSWTLETANRLLSKATARSVAWSRKETVEVKNTLTVVD